MANSAIQRYLEHLRVERRVSAHTLAAYGDALARLEKLADEAQRPLDKLQGAHIQRFAAQLHGAGLGARSIALTLSGWRGFYRWWSLQSDAADAMWASRDQLHEYGLHVLTRAVIDKALDLASRAA